MSFWVHCNNCYRQPDSESELRFYLTNCSHLFCEDCVPQCTKNQCKVCESQCSTLLLSGKMPKDIDAMFRDPFESMQKCLKQVHQIMDFQKSHQRRMMRHFREKAKMDQQRMEEMKNLLKQARAVERENLQLKQQIQYLTAISKKDVTGGRICPSSISQKLCGGSPADFPYPLPGNSGRLLLRTPPSGGRMGTIGPSYCHSLRESTLASITPKSVPRPLPSLYGSD